MNILVSGINGFIGSAVAQRLSADGHKISGLIRKERPSDQGRFPEVVSDLATNDILDIRDMGFDAVVHCAGLAHQPFKTAAAEFENTNVHGTRKIASAAASARIRQFVNISSVSVYGKIGYGREIGEDSQCNPATAYAKSKLGSESAGRRAFEGTNSRYLVLRPATVIGEGDRGNVAALIRMLDSNRFIHVGDGKNRKSFVYIKDLADAVEAVLSYPGTLQPVYNVTAEPIMVNQVVSTICEELGRRLPAVRVPAWPLCGGMKFLSQFVPNNSLRSLSASLEKWISDDAFSGEKLSKVCRIRTSAEQALRKEVRWYRDKK